MDEERAARPVRLDLTCEEAGCVELALKYLSWYMDAQIRERCTPDNSATAFGRMREVNAVLERVRAARKGGRDDNQSHQG